MKFENSRCLIVLRGLPGSGKSTLATVLSEGGKYPVFSIDDYFTDAESNEYCFDYKSNHLAYANCEKNTAEAMSNNCSKIILHNTFTLDWELEPYFKLASRFSYIIFVVTVENYHQHGNIHGVRDDQLNKMALKYKVKLM
jgi:predicted kinase